MLPWLKRVIAAVMGRAGMGGHFNFTRGIFCYAFARPVFYASLPLLCRDCWTLVSWVHSQTTAPTLASAGSHLEEGRQGKGGTLDRFFLCSCAWSGVILKQGDRFVVMEQERQCRHPYWANIRSLTQCLEILLYGYFFFIAKQQRWWLKVFFFLVWRSCSCWTERADYQRTGEQDSKSHLSKCIFV